MPPLRTHTTHDHGTFTHKLAHVHDDDLAARQSVEFVCPQGHRFSLTFADDAIPPRTWECRQHGVPAEPAELNDTRPPEHQPTKARSHWDMLSQRRREPELVQLLDTQLNALQTGQLVTVEQWLRQNADNKKA
jgi:RNA polymerase-binding protein